jgi:hypothetical protein
VWPQPALLVPTAGAEGPVLTSQEANCRAARMPWAIVTRPLARALVRRTRQGRQRPCRRGSSAEDSAPIVTAVESALERQLSVAIIDRRAVQRHQLTLDTLRADQQASAA